MFCNSIAPFRRSMLMYWFDQILWLIWFGTWQEISSLPSLTKSPPKLKLIIAVPVESGEKESSYAILANLRDCKSLESLTGCWNRIWQDRIWCSVVTDWVKVFGVPRLLLLIRLSCEPVGALQLGATSACAQTGTDSFWLAPGAEVASVDPVAMLLFWLSWGALRLQGLFGGPPALFWQDWAKSRNMHSKSMKFKCEAVLGEGP